MRIIRIVILNDLDRVPFVVRGRIERAFLGMGLFLALPLLFCGAFLLLEAIRNPLQASGTVILAAAFALALGGFLILFLVWPSIRRALARHEDAEESPPLTVYGEAVQAGIKATRILGEGNNLLGPM
jgi:hypothetical protein